MSILDVFKSKKPRKGQTWKAKIGDIVVQVDYVSKKVVSYSYERKSGTRGSYMTSVKDFIGDFDLVKK